VIVPRFPLAVIGFAAISLPDARADSNPLADPNLFGDPDVNPFSISPAAMAGSIPLRSRPGSRKRRGWRSLRFRRAGHWLIRIAQLHCRVDARLAPDVIEVALPTGDVTIRET
jgi:hypothetical protein